MSNIHSLSDLKKKGSGKGGAAGGADQPADYYAGGVGNDGGGSGVAIQLPNDPIRSIVKNASAGGPPDGAPTSGDIAVELYRNGFIVVNRGARGQFRPKEDPDNLVFLADLRRGQVPRELEQLAGTDNVSRLVGERVLACLSCCPCTPYLQINIAHMETTWRLTTI